MFNTNINRIRAAKYILSQFLTYTQKDRARINRKTNEYYARDKKMWKNYILCSQTQSSFKKSQPLREHYISRSVEINGAPTAASAVAT